MICSSILGEGQKSFTTGLVLRKLLALFYYKCLTILQIVSNSSGVVLLLAHFAFFGSFRKFRAV